MDLARIVLDFGEAVVKAYSAALGKQYLTVRTLLVSQTGKSNPQANERISFAIINESGPDIEIKEIWFLTSYYRRVFSKVINSKLPIRIRKKDRQTYFMPLEELKSTVNEKSGETITEAVIYDTNEHRYAGRVDKLLEQRIAR